MQSPKHTHTPTSPSLAPPRSPILAPVDWVGDAAASLLGTSCTFLASSFNNDICHGHFELTSIRRPGSSAHQLLSSQGQAAGGSASAASHSHALHTPLTLTCLAHPPHTHMPCTPPDFNGRASSSHSDSRALHIRQGKSQRRVAPPPADRLQGLFLAIRAVQTLRRLQSSRTIVIGIAGLLLCCPLRAQLLSIEKRIMLPLPPWVILLKQVPAAAANRILRKS
jgi:hypothetical protein